MSIQVNNVTKTYGEQKALSEVSFGIDDGDIVGFLGPNGAGKSTMMKIITGFIPQTAGDVFVNGMNVIEKSLEVRSVIGYLPEHNPLYHDMYVKEYLEFVAGLYKMGKKTKERVGEMIELTGLTIEQRKKIGALSKGYRQRVGLAQALIHDPQVLILDEPTTGLDPNQIVEIRNLITEVGKQKTVMLSTHIMQEVEAICDRVIIINQGRIVANEEAKLLRTHVSGAHQTVVVEFLEDLKIPELRRVKGISEIKSFDDNKWLIESESDKDIRPAIFRYAVDNQLTLLTMQKREKSMENIFRELTTDLKNK